MGSLIDQNHLGHTKVSIAWSLLLKATVIQVYVLTSNAEEAKLNGSMKIYKTF